MSVYIETEETELIAPEPAAPQPPSYLVAGESKGLALQFVTQLLAHPSQPVVVAGARSPQTATALQTLVSAFPGRAHIIQLDTADDKSIKAAAQWVDEHLDGRLDVLIINAGESPMKKWHEISFNEALDVFRVNTVGPLVLSAALLPALRKGSKKVMAHISSIAGSISSTAQGMQRFLKLESAKANASGTSRFGTAVPVYMASKVALNTEMLIMAGDLASEGFTVVSLYPGWMATDMGAGAAHELKSTIHAPDLRPHLTAEESVEGMIVVLDRLTPSDNGSFLDWRGSHVPW